MIETAVLTYSQVDTLHLRKALQFLEKTLPQDQALSLLSTAFFAIYRNIVWDKTNGFWQELDTNAVWEELLTSTEFDPAENMTILAFLRNTISSDLETVQEKLSSKPKSSTMIQ